MDHAATTYVRPEVLEAMIPYHTGRFGNPSSIYGIAREAKQQLKRPGHRWQKPLVRNPKKFILLLAGVNRITGP